MDGWEKWRVVCLAALSLEDIENIYLFGSMIRGLMLTGLAIALVYQKLKKMVTAAQSPTRLAGMIDGVGRPVGTQTMAIDRKLDTITVAIDRRFDNIMEKLTALQRILDGGDQRGH